MQPSVFTVNIKPLKKNVFVVLYDFAPWTLTFVLMFVL